MEIKLNEFYSRINSIFDNTSEQVSIIALKDIESVLDSTYKNISYNIYYYDEEDINSFIWVDVEGVNEGWLHTLDNMETDEDIMFAIEGSILTSIDAIKHNLNHNSITCFKYQDKGKILFHIVELSNDLTNRTDISILIELGGELSD